MTLTLGSLSLSDSYDIDHLILSEHGVDWEGLLKVLLGPVQLLGDGSSVELDFHNVGLLLALLKKLHLGVGNDSDDRTVLLHDLEVVLNLLLSQSILPLLASLSECLLLGLVPSEENIEDQ